MYLLSPQEIKQAIKDAHQRKPGVILSAMEIYEAIAQAQYDKDVVKEELNVNQKS